MTGQRGLVNASNFVLHSFYMILCWRVVVHSLWKFSAHSNAAFAMTKYDAVKVTICSDYEGLAIMNH